MRKPTFGGIPLCFLALLAMPAAAFAADAILKMSTTTSTESSGLLDILLPEFKKDTGIEVKVVAKGTGAAIRDGMDGNVDAIFVHARSREDEFVAQGYGTRRYAVMHNDFVIAGPEADPAGIGGLSDAAEALRKIVAAGATFVSRGDDSGTHTMEQFLWRETGLELETRTRTFVKQGAEHTVAYVEPAYPGYVSIGQGMGKTLTFADEKAAYTLTDRGTYIAYAFGRDGGLGLEILCEGDPSLFNPYGFIPVNPEKFPHANHDAAEAFARWIVSERGQSLIAGYQLHGKQLFFPDAIPDAR
jgi:tungstate transport system substrate-binding protein